MTGSALTMKEIKRCALEAFTAFFTKDYPLLEADLKRCVTGKGNYIVGHPLEIIQTLQDYSENRELAKEKYPLIALYTDFPVRKHQYDDFDGVTLQLVIVMSSEESYDTATREIKTFIPFLRPIQEHFIKALQASTIFSMLDDNELKVTIWERFFWGKTALYGNEALEGNDYIDAIQFENLELRLNVNDC